MASERLQKKSLQGGFVALEGRPGPMGLGLFSATIAYLRGRAIVAAVRTALFLAIHPKSSSFGGCPT
jgi:hypothetical protein